MNIRFYILSAVSCILLACSPASKAMRGLDEYREMMKTPVNVVDETKRDAQALSILSTALDDSIEAIKKDPTLDHYRLLFEVYASITHLGEPNPELATMVSQVAFVGLDSAHTPDQSTFFCYQLAKLLLSAHLDVPTYREVRACSQGVVGGSLYRQEALEYVDILQSLADKYKKVANE
ncbi:hypothetical protein IT409_02075 [Candidatus Falkowbacteria bacterium]|nr:hypothetical protein [Candidatus Falkowbacteria bacterium]